MNAPLPVIESAVVMPSIGDDVLFQLNGLKLTSPSLSILTHERPLHAKVVYVLGPAMVNLVVWDHYGNAHKMTSVKFLAPGEDVLPGSTYCELSVIPGELIEGELDAPAQPAHSPAIQKGIDAVTSTPPCGRPLTFGEKAVGIGFNPGGSGAVGFSKAVAAQLIDLAHELRQSSESTEVKRMASLAITAAQEAQMWLVKAQTWKD